MQTKGGNFILSQVDPAALHLPAVPKRVSVADGALKIKNTNTDKTEFKVKLERGCMQARARVDVPNLLMLSFFATRSNPTPKTFALLAEDRLRLAWLHSVVNHFAQQMIVPCPA